MTPNEIETMLHQMVDQLRLVWPEIKHTGGLPRLTVTVPPKDGRPGFRLVCGAEPLPTDEQEPPPR